MKEAVKQYIKVKLNTDSAWATKAVLKIYRQNQTCDEQVTNTTNNLNGIGFSGVDATILSSFAQQVEKGRNLSVKQLAILFKKMPRYWKQVASFIPEEKMREIENNVCSKA